MKNKDIVRESRERKLMMMMGSNTETEIEGLMLKGQVEIWKLMFGYADSMVLKAAVQLSIPDIINSHSHPISLSQIASGIDSTCVDMGYLARIMRFRVHKQIFTIHPPSLDNEETLYGLTQSSKWLPKNSELTLNPLVIMENHPVQKKPWHYIAQCVKEGETPFKKAHGCEIWDFAAKNSEFNNIFNDALGCTAKVVMKAVLSEENKCFDGLMSLVDVGGGTGGNLVEILKVNPQIKGINFDLPHVVSTAPAFEGIEHVGGDMFDVLPKGDAIFMKWILHDWGDEYCVKMLRNCRKAIPEKTGKLIIVEIILEENGKNNPFGDMGLVLDLAMLALTKGGKERTEIVRRWRLPSLQTHQNSSFTIYY